MIKIKVINGVYWLDIPEANLFILCGCPADIIKHLMKKGFIVNKIADGMSYETGPNAILLSDVSSQNGSFSNLAEFPILQMLYRQGMILPGHPNNTGLKPILIGTSTQILAQSEYIYRGNYGLADKKEITSAGIPADVAEEMYRLKMKFAFNHIRKTEELIDFCIVEQEPVEIRNKVFVCRKDLNVYEFRYKDNKVEIDLNLGPLENYEPPVYLDFHRIKREYFSIIHIGDGDGWDVHRPCMASIISYRGMLYLIDTGPNILQSLIALGININEIEGIFHTHAHDDHFAGLTSLVRSDHLIKYFAPPLVRASVLKKLFALMRISEERFNRLFEVHNLRINKWNNIGGLEVKPVFSLHPVETVVLLFRAFGPEGYKVYAHFADIASKETLKKYLVEDPDANEISGKLYKMINKNYIVRADIKKIDVGGGLIHGNAEDFINDTSKKIFLSHTHSPLTNLQKEIGSNATFGMEDVLIKSHQDYSMKSAYHYLRNYFPDVPAYQLDLLLNCPVLPFNVGQIIIKRGIPNKYAYLILNGVVEFIDSKMGFRSILSAGSLIGEYTAFTQKPALRTYRTMSYVNAIQIPIELYREFVKRTYHDVKEFLRVFENRLFLQRTWLLGEMVSGLILNNIARNMKMKSVKMNEQFVSGKEPEIIMLKKGEIELKLDEMLVDTLNPGDFFGEESFFLKQSNLLRARAIKNSEVFFIPGEELSKKPIIEWKLLEVFEKRLQAFGQQFNG